MNQTLEKTVSVVRPGSVQSLNVSGCGVNFLCEGEATGEAFSLMDLEMPCEAMVPPHRHDWDEAYYILSGTIDFVLDGKPERAEPGTFLYVPAGKIHTFTNVSKKEPARMLVVDAPAHAGKFFREVDRKVKRAEDVAQLAQIGAAHGIEFTASPEG